MTTDLEDALATVNDWGADHAAAALVGPDGILAQHGDADRYFRWASITKLATALAVLSAVDDDLVDLDEPAGPPGSTVRHLLAHASGLPFEGGAPIAAPGTRRIYSNAGFDVLGDLLVRRSGQSFDAVLAERVLAPLHMAGTRLQDGPSQGLQGPLTDLAAIAREALRPTIARRDTLALATSVAFPGLKGLLPGLGTFDPLDWGLGFEIRDAKVPHWTGTGNSPQTFGHFGGAGTFLWVDPALDRALVCLTDREFGPWALEAWPAFADIVIESSSRGADAQSVR
ncbi:MAG TPA: serine hydrolase domain-containing protein [Candidatus Limnocylindrales bacterium]|nr:serine hydrolase domain-containing protein [Candidatus Limnocylindrales bacterium]